ncbi:MAG: hypothetical protein IPO08_20575 [Xanthomonadales bacterium]|nr:hypothetical protein [Xanthomonadales bacterium]
MNWVVKLWRWLFPRRAEVYSIEVRSSPPGSFEKWHLVIQWDNGDKWPVRGDWTVFHRYPTGERLQTWLEVLCSQAVTAHKWSRE